ncbi:MAG TPA: response regulator [Anaerolineaceae bacterium]
MAKILFVDDDALTLQLMERLAGFLGHQALLTSSPENGLKIAEESQPDLILVDMLMQSMSGLVFVEKLRSLPALKSIPVLVLSAGTSWQDPELANKAGANGYLSKPLSIDDLETALKKYVPGVKPQA